VRGGVYGGTNTGWIESDIFLILRESLVAKNCKKIYKHPHFSSSPYQLRAEALERVLSNEEFARVLIHIAQRRGYQSNSTAEAAADEKETGRVKIALAENRKCMEEHGYRTIGEMMYCDERFWGQNPDGTKYPQTRNNPTTIASRWHELMWLEKFIQFLICREVSDRKSQMRQWSVNICPF
jgi:CRISPR/Cas system Type II protein with McrA/HNH and RuvC-like nuclease domain